MCRSQPAGLSGTLCKRNGTCRINLDSDGKMCPSPHEIEKKLEIHLGNRMVYPMVTLALYRGWKKNSPPLYILPIYPPPLGLCTQEQPLSYFSLFPPKKLLRNFNNSKIPPLRLKKSIRTILHVLIFISTLNHAIYQVFYTNIHPHLTYPRYISP